VFANAGLVQVARGGGAARVDLLRELRGALAAHPNTRESGLAFDKVSTAEQQAAATSMYAPLHLAKLRNNKQPHSNDILQASIP